MSDWTPRSPERSRNWESWVFECAAALFSRYSDNEETIEVEKIVSLTKKDEPTTKRLAISLYPVKLAEVLAHATSSRIINQETFSRILIDTMHRLEVFDKATTSASRDPDLKALVSNLYKAVSKDPVLSAHSSKLGKTLQKDLWLLSRKKEKLGLDEKNTMTAQEWLRFAAEYTLRTKLTLPPPLSPCRPIRSPLAEDRPRRPSVLYPEDMIQRSLSLEFKENSRHDLEKRKFSLIAVNQIQNDIDEIRRVLDAERAMVCVSCEQYLNEKKKLTLYVNAQVRDLNSKVSQKDKEIVDLKKEIVVLYAERNRSAKHHQLMQQDTIEMGRLREELKRSQSNCEMLRSELDSMRQNQKKGGEESRYVTLPSQQTTKISLHDTLLNLISESFNRCSKGRDISKPLRKKILGTITNRFLELEVDADNALNAFEYELQLGRFC